MNILAITIIIIICILSYKITKDIIHPAVITSGVWGIIIFVYNILNHGLYPLSDKFYFALLIWVVAFCVIALLMSKIEFPFPTFLKGQYNNKLIKVLIPILILSLILSIIALYQRGMVYNVENVFTGIRQASVSVLNGEVSEYSFPKYMSFAISLSCSSFLILLCILFMNKQNKQLTILLTVLVLLFFLFRSSKTVMAQVVFAFICMLIIFKKLTLKNLLFYLLAIVVLMMATHLLRRGNSDFSLNYFLTLYVLGPLPAFDSILQGNIHYIHSFNGEYTFRFLVPLIQLFDPSIVGNPDPFNLNNWVEMPLKINVFTIMFSYFVDFGYFGLFIFSSFLGLFWGVLYQYMKRGYDICRLIYAAFFYMLVFQFFSDFFFQFFFNTLEIILVSILIFLPIKIRKKTI